MAGWIGTWRGATADTWLGAVAVVEEPTEDVGLPGGKTARPPVHRRRAMVLRLLALAHSDFG